MAPGFITRIIRSVQVVWDLARAEGLEHMPWVTTRRSVTDDRSMHEQSTLNQERRYCYRDYDDMDSEMVEISSALDVYADNATAGTTGSEGDLDKSFEIKTDNPGAIEVFELVEKNLRLKERVWGWARNLAKYGDHWIEQIVGPPGQIVQLRRLHPSSVEEKSIRKNLDLNNLNLRDLGLRFAPSADNNVQIDSPVPPNEPSTIQPYILEKFWAQVDSGGNAKATFAKWQLAHFAIKRDFDDTYGSSILHPVRRLFRQLRMMEDGMVIQRLARAARRNAYLIDTGKLSPRKALEYVEEVKTRMTKKTKFDNQGRMKLINNPLTDEEDIWLPHGEGAKSDVKPLEGAGNLDRIEDVKYFQNKLFGALKVPKTYLGMDPSAGTARQMTHLDIQFARSVRRLQYFLAVGMRQIYDVALILANLDPRNVDYEILFPLIGSEDELQKWQIWQLRLGAAKALRIELGLPIADDWLLKNIVGLSDDQIADLGVPPGVITAPPESPFGGFAQGAGGPVETSSGEKEVIQKLLASPPIRQMGRDIRALLDWRYCSNGVQDTFAHLGESSEVLATRF